MVSLASCEATYPARAIVPQLARLIKEEINLNATCRVSGKTLWVYLPLEDLVENDKVSWNAPGLEKVNKAIGVVHRVVLSSDADLDFAAVVGADVKKYGVAITVIEYVPDFKEAVYEKFSRGEFFARNVRDVNVNPETVGDLTGETMNTYDISFSHFLGLQILSRTRNIFAKDKTLSRIFEVKSVSQSEKFGIIRLEFEFTKKTYDLSAEEEAIRPLDTAAMVVALVIRNYNYEDFQQIVLIDTFADANVKFTPEAIRKIKIKLPRIDE